MSKVRILPEFLSNKIAAGEVVDRPASVTKELIENAIDAESTKIIVEIRKGGISLIRVSDNGIGMGRDDALLSLERFATSKIRDNDDLCSIKTLGFRGEAIPSIASVSKFSIVTRERHVELGTEVKVSGGKIKQVSDCGAPSGSVVTVKDLFFNIPARKKFLKSVNTEIYHIADIMASMAIARPDIRFKLLHNGRTIKDWPKCNNTFGRLTDVLGTNLAKQSLVVEAEENTILIKGWIVDPQINRTTSRGIYLFVNGRYIKDKILHQSLLLAYKRRLRKRKYPIAVIFIVLPYDQVDVNVHPAKHEVRFLNQNQIYDFLCKTISRVLSKLDQPKLDCSISNVPPISKVKNVIPSRNTDSLTNKFADSIHICKSLAGKTANIDNNKNSNYQTCLKNNTLSKGVLAYRNEHYASAHDIEPYSQAILWEQKFFSDLVIVGQYHNTYVICESREILIVIDQHAAHERVLFEQLKLSVDQDNSISQKLLIPELVDINFNEARVLKKLIPNLGRYGLEIEPFGGNTFVIKAVPALINNNKISSLVIELIEKVTNIGGRPDVHTITRECLALMACHNAIRANQYLSKKEIRVLLHQLDSCVNPGHCPHGRPTWIKLELSDIEKNFDRRS